MERAVALEEALDEDLELLAEITRRIRDVSNPQQIIMSADKPFESWQPNGKIFGDKWAKKTSTYAHGRKRNESKSWKVTGTW